MKTISRHFQTFAILATGALTAQLAVAQTELWSGGGGAGNQNWSSTANWSLSAVPGAATIVVFTNNAGAAASPGTVDNIVDSDFAGTIASLQYCNTNTSGTSGFFHTTQIGAGQTLTNLGNLEVGLFNANDFGGANQINASFTGQGTLLMTNPGAFLGVSQGSGTSSTQGATLNMTNLSTFNATIGGIYVGIYNTPNASLARQRGNLYLAQTNIINLIGSSAPHAYGNESQIEIGEELGNGPNSTLPLYLGIMNTIYVGSITVGADKQGSGALLAFNPVFTNNSPVAIIAGTNGPTSRVVSWKVADNSNQTTSGSGTSGTVDFSNGSLNALVNTLYLGLGESGGSAGSGGGTGTFTFNAGTNNVNTLYLGYVNATGGNGTASGTMNVNGTGTLIANNAICLSYYPPGSSAGYASGTLNINGGTVSANTITNGVATGANGTANVNVFGGNLGITGAFGCIGTYIAPVKSLSLSNAVLQLAVNPFQTNIEVSTLSLYGTSNYVSISSIPSDIITYPTQIPLISYISGSMSGTFNIQLTNNLPGTYQGYVTNNTSNSSIDIVLTGGPTSVTSLTWNGLANNDWDLSSLDWSNGTLVTAYADGSIATFNDTAPGPTDINIVSAVAPTSTTFGNNTLPYAFSGGGIMGFGSVTMNGSGTVLFTNSGNAFAGGLNVNSGTVQFGNGGTSGNLPTTGNVLDNSSLILDHSGNVNVPNTISGTGTLTESGTSTLTLTASNSFSGAAVVNGGTLVLNGVLSGTLNSALGTTVGGAGTNLGTVTAGGLVQPATSTGTPSTFSTGDLNLSSGATLGFDLNGNNQTTGNGVNDELMVYGNLTANNNTVYLNFLTAPAAGSTYTLLNYSGTQNGNLNSTVAGTHFGATLTQGSSPVQVTISGTGANLKWDAKTNNLWNIGTSSNWLNLGTSAQDVYYQGDDVIFDDSVAGVTNIISIPTGVSVSPTVLSNNSSVVNYTINGPGQIIGGVNIIKQGSSTMNISSANLNFTGTATVAGGVLQVGSGNAFGTAGTVIVTNNATLDLDNQGIGNIPVIVAGTGTNGAGAIINSVVSVNGDQHAVDNVELTGNATFGGAGRWDIRNNGSQNGSLSTSGNPYNLTKVGTNLIALVDCGISGIGNIDVQGGELGLQENTASLSSGWLGSGSTSTISVENGATLELYSLGTSFPLYLTFDLNNGSTLLSDVGNNQINGNIVLSGNATISVTGGTTPWLYMDGVISGSGNLIVTGAVPFIVSGTNTYTGNTLINSGILQLGYGASADGFISDSSNIVIAANAILDVSEMSSQTIIVTNGQTLRGNGSVYGNVIVAPGATISAGTSSTAVGVLTITNSLTLLGNTLMKLNPSTVVPTNDVINVIDGASITNGGTLTVTNISASSFAAGMTFQLFNAGNFVGSFSSISPATPGPGLAWNTNNLSTAGTLSVVVGAAPPTPHITSIVLSGTQLVINGTNGVASEQYNVLTTTNLLTPIANWTVLPAGAFTANAFSITNTVTVKPASFYMIRVP